MKLLFENWRKFKKLNERVFTVQHDMKNIEGDVSKKTMQVDVSPNYSDQFYTDYEVAELYDLGGRLEPPEGVDQVIWDETIKRKRNFMPNSPMLYKHGPNSPKRHGPRRDEDPETRRPRAGIDVPPEKTKLTDLPYNHPKREAARKVYCKKYPEKCKPKITVGKSEEDPDVVSPEGWCDVCIDWHVDNILTHPRVQQLLGALTVDDLESAIQTGVVEEWIEKMRDAHVPGLTGAQDKKRRLRQGRGGSGGGPAIFGITPSGKKVSPFWDLVDGYPRFDGPKPPGTTSPSAPGFYSVIRSFYELKLIPPAPRFLAYQRRAAGTNYEVTSKGLQRAWARFARKLARRPGSRRPLADKDPEIVR